LLPPPPPRSPLFPYTTLFRSQGVRDADHAERVRRVLSAFELAPELARSDYEQAAAIYRACGARGTTPRSAIDCLIAQLCLRYGRSEEHTSELQSLRHLVCRLL